MVIEISKKTPYILTYWIYERYKRISQYKE